MRRFMAAVAATFILASASAAMAAPLPFTTTNFSFGYDHFSGSGAKLDGGNLGLGWRFGRFVGFEFGGDYATGRGTKFGNMYLEAQGVLPIRGGLHLFASAGGAYAGTWAGVGGSRWGTGYRVGGGVEYDLTSFWAIRGAYHYQNALAKLSNYSLGVVLKF